MIWALDIFYYLKMKKTIETMNLKKETVINRPKEDIATDIQEAIDKLNELMKEANNVNLSVTVAPKQYSSPVLGEPLNRPIGVTITYTFPS